MQPHDTSVRPDDPVADLPTDPSPASPPASPPDVRAPASTEPAEADSNTPLPPAADDSARWIRWILVLFAVAMTVQWVRLTQQRPVPPVVQRGEAFHQLFRVNVNDATWVEWMQLEGIGQSLAHRIVADRDINGPFRSIDDLTRVTGIGPKTLDRIRPWLTITHANHSARPGDAAEPESRFEFHAR